MTLTEGGVTTIDITWGGGKITSTTNEVASITSTSTMTGRSVIA
jgi:hypothetical protein